jgi:hypothetical protein
LLKLKTCSLAKLLCPLMRAALALGVALAKTVNQEAVYLDDHAVVRADAHGTLADEDASGGQMTCFIEDGTEVTSKTGETAKGGVFIRSVFNQPSCKNCQVPNIGEFQAVGPYHIANLVEAERKVLVNPNGVGPATFAKVADLEQDEVEGKTQFCFCKVPFGAKKLDDDGQSQRRMKSAISFKGNARTLTCTPMDCYKKYIYYAERYVMNVKPYTTAMYKLERQMPGAASNAGAWTRVCCEANTDGCAITGGESDGYTLNGRDTAAAEGATITSVAELRDVLDFAGPEMTTEGDDDILSFEYRCKVPYCQVDGVGNAVHECVMTMGKTEQVVATHECEEQGVHLPTCDMLVKAECYVKRENDVLKACAGCGGECTDDPETVESVMTLMNLTPFGLS